MFIYVSIIFIAILLLFCIFIIYLDIYPAYNLEYIDKEILNYANESLQNNNYKEFNITSKRFIFSPFVELFNGNSVPSRFINTNLNEFYVVNYLLHSPEIQMDPNYTTTSEVIIKLNNQITRSEKLVSDLVEIAISYHNYIIEQSL
jgi:hypothetical protein